MIDIKDLQIGDWVFDGDEAARITSLTCDGIIETTRRISNIEIVAPIPLTPEILEKNGFWGKEQGHYYRYSFGGSDNPIYIHHQNDKVACSTTNNRNELALFGMIVLTYIHQLQHALRLCGIEKEIEL